MGLFVIEMSPPAEPFDLYTQIAEQLLLLRCQLGDNDALAELIRRYQTPLHGYIENLINASDFVDDISQDTWLTVIRQIRTLRNLHAFQVWMYRIARNKALKKLGKQKFVPLCDDNIPVQNTQQDSLLSTINIADLRHGLTKLSIHYREILLLHFFQHMSYQQISDIVGCPVGTVKSRLYYAKRELKKELEK